MTVEELQALILEAKNLLLSWYTDGCLDATTHDHLLVPTFDMACRLVEVVKALDGPNTPPTRIDWPCTCGLFGGGPTVNEPTCPKHSARVDGECRCFMPAGEHAKGCPAYRGGDSGRCPECGGIDTPGEVHHYDQCPRGAPANPATHRGNNG